MISSGICDVCGAVLPENAPEGLCTRCLIRSVLMPLPAPDLEAEFDVTGLIPQRSFAGYELTEEIARGGMGIVFKARQQKPKRWVALKIVSGGELASPKLLDRFRVEAEAAASLSHPHIVPIYEVGECRGLPFFSMRLIEGQTLREAMSGKPMPPRQAVTLLVTIARAVHYAHQHGILHRDLKPNNILLDAQGMPHLTDFGLAKVLENDTDLTLSGAVLGTPSYMSPEQAAGLTREITTASDVYSLGAIFYETLTGRPPFTGTTSLEVVRQVMDQEPPRPCTWRRDVPRELEIICLKCLEKDPARRYGSAERLAEDLERWVRHEPIRAQPTTLWEHGVKWVRRHRARTALFATLGLSLVIFTVGSVVFNIRLTAARKAEGRHRQVAEQSSEQSRQRMVQLNVAAGNRWMEEEDHYRGVLWFAEALRLENGDAAREEIHRYRIEAALRHTPGLRQILFHAQEATCVQFSPEGERLLTGSVDHTARIWQVDTGNPLTPPLDHETAVGAATFSPDGRRVATFSLNGQARIWDAVSGQPLSPPLRHLEFRPVSNRFRPALAFSPDGSQLLSAYGSSVAHLWQGVDGRALRELKHPAVVYDAAFSADGRRVVTACADGNARLWEAGTGSRTGPLLSHTQEVAWVSFSPDGSRVLTVANRRVVRVWDVATGLPLGMPMAHSNAMNSMLLASFSPDGSRVLTAGWDNSARVWDAATGQGLFQLKHRGGVMAAAFSPDGGRVATACWDGTARVWDTASGLPLTSALPQGASLLSLAFSPDGHELATTSVNGTVRVWHVRTRDSTIQRLPHADAVWAQFSLDGRRIATASAGNEGGACVWDAQTGLALTPPLLAGEPMHQATLSRDGKRLVTRSGDGTVRIWDVGRATETVPALRHPSRVGWIALSPDGRRLVAACDHGAAHVWDMETGLAATPPLLHGDAVVSAEFNASGTLIVTASRDATARIWNAATGEPRVPSLDHDGPVGRAIFSEDGTRVATTCEPRGEARDHALVWEVATGQRVTPPLIHDAALSDVAFDPLSRRVATACIDGSVRIWDAASGRLLTAPLRSATWAKQVAFSPDGRRLASGSEDGALYIWDSMTGELASPRLHHAIRHEVIRFDFSPDGGRMVIAGSADAVWVRHLPKTEDSVEALILRAQVLSGHRIDPLAGLMPLELSALSNGWQRLGPQRPRDITPVKVATVAEARPDMGPAADGGAFEE